MLVTGVSTGFIGVTLIGTFTVTTFPFGKVTVTSTGPLFPGVVKSGISPTLAVEPSGILTCFKISSGVNLSFVTGVSIGFTGVTVTGTLTGGIFLPFFRVMVTSIVPLSPGDVKSGIFPISTLASSGTFR